MVFVLRILASKSTLSPQMNRFIKLLCFALVVGQLLQASDKPNIILIMVDDLGRETVGAYGGTTYRTPNLDRLANEGILFENCHALLVELPNVSQSFR